jgi:APA family basic amino acid/polyamine antiporter
VGQELKKKYGLLTAVAMVVGIVIGSGVFFKAEVVLKATGGNMPLGIAAWGIVGLIMIICSFSFATMAAKYVKMNGLVDYAEMTVGGRYAYYIGWFMAVVYNPTMTSVLAWVSARYFCVLLGWDITGGSAMTFAAFFLIASYAMNALSPVIAGKFQVTTTVIKLIPLLLMAVIGTVAGIMSGMTADNFSRVINTDITVRNGLFDSIVAVAFAYEGWIIATSINAELRDAKRNLPAALVFGSLIVVFVYIFYYIGLAGAVTTEALMESGQTGAKLAFQNIFGTLGGTLIFVFVIISCLGTLNGLMMGNTRGMYALAARGKGPKPAVFGLIDTTTNMPANSSIAGLLLAGFWLLYFYGANLLQVSWFGPFSFDTSELPIITLYGAYIPIFLRFMMKEKDLGIFRRLVMPALSILSCLFMVAAAIIAHRWTVFYYLVIFLAFMLAGACFTGKKERRQ